MGGSDISLPSPSPIDRELQAEQTRLLRLQSDILTKQLKQQNLLAPFLLRSQGLKPILDDAGDVIGFEEDPTSLQAKRLGLEEKFIARSEAALKGELPVEPGLMRGLEEEERTVRDVLRRQLGPEYETSTPGSQRLADLFKRKTELIEGARRGDLTLGEQLSLARQSSVQAGVQPVFSSLFGPQTQLASLFGQAAGGYEGPLGRGLKERQLSLEAAIANAQASASRFGAIAGLGGTALGAGLGTYGAFR